MQGLKYTTRSECGKWLAVVVAVVVDIVHTVPGVRVVAAGPPVAAAAADLPVVAVGVDLPGGTD